MASLARGCVLGDANARFGELDSVAFRSFDAADDEDEVMAEVVYERQSVYTANNARVEFF